MRLSGTSSSPGKKKVQVHPPYIRIEERLGAPEGKAGQGACGVRPYAGELYQCGRIAWKLAVELVNDHAGGVPKAQRPVPVAESLPTCEVGWTVRHRQELPTWGIRRGILRTSGERGIPVSAVASTRTQESRTDRGCYAMACPGGGCGPIRGLGVESREFPSEVHPIGLPKVVARHLVGAGLKPCPTYWYG